MRHRAGLVSTSFPVALIALQVCVLPDLHAGQAPTLKAMLEPAERWITVPHPHAGSRFDLSGVAVDAKDMRAGKPTIGFTATCSRAKEPGPAGYAEIRWTGREDHFLPLAGYSMFRFSYKASVSRNAAMGSFFVRFTERWDDGCVHLGLAPVKADGKWHTVECPLVLYRKYLKVKHWRWRIRSFSINSYIIAKEAGKDETCSMRFGGFDFVPKTPEMLAQDAADRARSKDKQPAYLVMMHRAVEGEPEPDLRMNHFCLPDPKLRAQFSKLGFEVGVAPYCQGLTMDYLQQFNVAVVLHPCMPGFSPGLDGVVEEKKKLLLDWVKAGGGLLVLRTQGWQFGKDIDELNRWLAPCDIEILSEQVVDKEYKTKLESGYELSWTDNVAPHPVTEGVQGIFYTTYHHMYADTTSPVKAGKDWIVVLRGKNTTKCLRTIKGGNPPPPKPGTYASEPPLLAVRGYGKGRIAVWPINSTCVWQDGYHALWGRGLTMDGKASNMRGDAAKLLCNLMTWLAEPSRGAFGGFVPKRIYVEPEVGFRRIDWDNAAFKGACAPHCFEGIIGAKSSLSTGQGTPQEFIQAAQQAGYDFIGFTEDLGKLTQEKFNRLRQICKQHSTDTFRAYPGFAYLDDSGNSWVTFSDRLRWPEKGWWSQKHPGRLSINNPLSRGCQWPPVILTKLHSNPEKPWHQGNFKAMSLYTYERGKLVDDSLDYYLRLQRMRYQLTPVAVHVVRSPEEVKRAKSVGFQTYVRWFDSHMVDAMSGHIGRYKDRYVWFRSCFVSEGPILEDARILNFGTSDLAIPGNDRFRLHVRATSPAGLREVALLDGDRPRPWRRFLPGGAKEFDTSIDHFHDKQYDLVLCATDVHGKRAIGWDAWTSVQENQFPRCSDNINTMPRGKWWGPPEHMQNVRGIENYLAVRNFRCVGLPTWAGIEESPRHAVAYYPFLACRFGTILDCIIDEHYPRTASGNLNHTDQPECAVPNEYLTGTVRHTLFTPWQDGSLAVLVEGSFVAKQPFQLKRGYVLAFNGRKGADGVCATMADGTLLAGKLTKKRRHYAGELPDAGFAALFHQPFQGSIGMISLQAGLRFLAFDGGKGYGNFRGLLAGDNRDVKPGEKLTYRYLAVNSALDAPPDNRFVTDVCNTLGIQGRTAYSVEPKIGSVASTRFVLKLRADKCGFSGRITEAKLPLHLPTQIEGLNPRWHAGIWYKGPHTFTIAEWIVNDMNQRYTVRKKRTVKDEIHHFPVLDDGTGFLQIDTSVRDKEVFIGNLLVSDNAAVCLTLTQASAARAAFVAHNPTDEPITCEVRPGPGFTLLGDFARTATIPAGSSVEIRIAAR